jgi:hypothetical protein
MASGAQRAWDCCCLTKRDRGRARALQIITMCIMWLLQTLHPRFGRLGEVKPHDLGEGRFTCSAGIAAATTDLMSLHTFDCFEEWPRVTPSWAAFRPG